MSTLRSITPSLYQISLGAVNVFVIKDNGLTLIDTGYKGSMNKIFSALEQGSENPNAIRQVILTHAHPDHAGSAADIKRELGVPILAHHLEASLLEEGLSGRAPIHLSPGVINWIIYQLFIKRGNSAIDPVLIDKRLNHGDVIPVAGGLQVLHTPGHSTGHIALLLQNEGVLLAGDTCANIAGLGLSTVYEDLALGVKSLLALSELSFDQAVFGHGGTLKQQANHKFKATFSGMRGV
ncbi:MBL fold metallo-hydrolase [Spirosoma sp. KNUC1025]|uniref:MBL fold metallo-hydrolase n=1 Tax=Spirosoma sp. KNUC1025 TaxID=2894082 RepID=UPI00386BBB55|nr:MBL fold metallo-hydrolase [Spirosoma sp. KNUC1025]